jgi:hypothetical protein
MLKPRPKMLIIGHARHGKDTVAQILSEGWGYKFCSSSWAACERVIFPILQHKYNYNSPQECFDDRVNHRAEWKQLITEYNTPDKTRLAREILVDNDIYVGMRCVEELKACLDQGLFQQVVWVDASLRKEPEPKSSNTIPQSMSMSTIDNNGDLKDLVYEVFKFMKQERINERGY